MRIVSEYILKWRIKSALNLCFVDAGYFYLPVYHSLKATFKEKFVFESYENEPLDKHYLCKIFEGKAIDSNLDFYFAYLGGNYTKIEKNQEIESFYQLHKSPDNSYDKKELIYQLFWALFEKPNFLSLEPF
jgi:hypothetical protein